jgi:DNA-directed RNA polymerase subunit RPC12/RpoP
MSDSVDRDIACPECGHVWVVSLLESLHSELIPRFRQLILDRRMHLFDCPRCGQRTAVEAPLLYTDFSRGHYVAVEPPTADWRVAEEDHRAVFDSSFVAAPPLAQELGRKLRPRLVLGLAALREKLLLWDAGLDDVVVEALKAEHEARAPGPPRSVLRLATLLEGGHLLLSRTSAPPRSNAEMVVTAPPAPLGLVTITAEQYQQRAHDRATVRNDHPWLVEEWYVDVARRA